MDNIALVFVSDQGVEASIHCDGSQGGQEDYFSEVTVKGFMENKKVYGVDPVQAFSLGMKLIEQLTEDKRLAGEKGGPIDGTSWRIESATK